MKLLISAYACAPHRGSEHGVGWNWATEAHRLGHSVWALVAPNHRDAIARACAAAPELADIHWIFPEVPGWPLRQGIEPKWERTYNLLWQARIVPVARRLHAAVGFDAVHHLTWGGVRAPTFLGSLGVPLILGPLGGGETSPRSLRDAFGPRARCVEAVRDLSNRTITINPVVRRGLADASVIFVRTTETRRLLSRKMQEKAFEFIELGLQERPAAEGERPAGGGAAPLRMLFAGRLLYWKGAHIAIRALALLVRSLPDARLTIVGTGKEESRLRAAAASCGVADNVEFIRWLPQERLFSLYRSHHLLLFPSLHDSGGTVVLEALSFGLPVVCLDLGGPKELVTAESGIVVGTRGRDSAQVADAVAREILDLYNSPPRLARLSEGALARADEFLIATRAARLYDIAGRFIGSSGAHGSRAFTVMAGLGPGAHDPDARGKIVGGRAKPGHDE